MADEKTLEQELSSSYASPLDQYNLRGLKVELGAFKGGVVRHLKLEDFKNEPKVSRDHLMVIVTMGNLIQHRVQKNSRKDFFDMMEKIDEKDDYWKDKKCSLEELSTEEAQAVVEVVEKYVAELIQSENKTEQADGKEPQEKIYSSQQEIKQPPKEKVRNFSTPQRVVFACYTKLLIGALVTDLIRKWSEEARLAAKEQQKEDLRIEINHTEIKQQEQKATVVVEETIRVDRNLKRKSSDRV